MTALPDVECQVNHEGWTRATQVLSVGKASQTVLNQPLAQQREPLTVPDSQLKGLLISASLVPHHKENKTGEACLAQQLCHNQLTFITFQDRCQSFLSSSSFLFFANSNIQEELGSSYDGIFL